MKPRIKAYIHLHIAVLLFGFTAILGKLISLSAFSLVWHRMWIAAIGLLLMPGVFKGIKTIKNKDRKRFLGIGVLIALHWLTFYGSIKLGGNASLTLACLSTVTLFTAFLEPWFTKSKFNWLELLLGLIIIFGILIIAQIGAAYHTAIGVGLLSAFLAALFSTLNKKYIQASYNSLSISFLELSAGWLFLVFCTPFFQKGFDQNFSIPPKDVLYLTILAVFCTSIAFALSVMALKELSAFTTNLAINLEPIYGIVLAAILFEENKDLGNSFYTGTGIILAAVFAHPIVKKFQRKSRKRVHT